MSENYKFNQNKDCEYFPCHEVKDKESFNCLFCYCPLYALGDKCGGNFTYTDNGIKNCTNCTLTHSSNGYSHVMSKIGKIIEIGSKKD